MMALSSSAGVASTVIRHAHDMGRVHTADVGSAVAPPDANRADDAQAALHDSAVRPRLPAARRRHRR